jgi:hypothetical protein
MAKILAKLMIEIIIFYLGMGGGGGYHKATFRCHIGKIR